MAYAIVIRLRHRVVHAKIPVIRVVLTLSSANQWVETSDAGWVDFSLKAFDRGEVMAIIAIFIVGFASLVFFSTILIVAALILRGHWDDLAKRR